MIECPTTSGSEIPVLLSDNDDDDDDDTVVGTLHVRVETRAPSPSTCRSDEPPTPRRSCKNKRQTRNGMEHESLNDRLSALDRERGGAPTAETSENCAHQSETR
jgi:hypothetical protein